MLKEKCWGGCREIALEAEYICMQETWIEPPTPYGPLSTAESNYWAPNKCTALEHCQVWAPDISEEKKLVEPLLKNHLIVLPELNMPSPCGSAIALGGI